MKLSLDTVAEICGAKLEGNPNVVITGVAPLQDAGPQDVSFYDQPLYAQASYRRALEKTLAGVVLIHPDIERPEGPIYLLTESPSQAFQRLLDFFYAQKDYTSGFEGIHPTAVIHEEAHLAEGVSVGPYAILDRGVSVGKGTQIAAHVVIGPHSTVGEDCMLYPHVTIREGCHIGNRVILQPGVVIGSCGFGYHTDKKGIHTKLQQIGDVVIEDDVEIGANSTIDRARFTHTVVGEGTKIDNLVMAGHGVRLGKYNLIVAQTGLAGSSSTGRNVVMAGQSALVGHAHLPDGTIIAGRGAVSKTLTKRGEYAGVPAVPLKDFHHQHIHLRNLDKYVKRIKELEERVARMEEEGAHP